MSERNMFLREDFDPLLALFGSSSTTSGVDKKSDVSADDIVIIPPISNIKPYKTFDAINLDQLLLKNKQKQSQTNKKKKEASVAVNCNNDKNNSSSSSSLSSLSTEQNQSSASSKDSIAGAKPSNMPDVKDLPTLPYLETYRGFLEYKYGGGQSTVPSSQHSFGLLYQAVMEKKRVGVMVKTRHGHSKLEGVLSGFDRFFNMILLDVKEHYKELEIRFKKQRTLDKERGIIVLKKKKKNNRKRRVRCLVEKEREFPLLFIKGCQVISVMMSIR